jgi:hypothetical protein
MELVPIIYNSLLIVVSVLSFILILSFLCSKILICKTTKREEKRNTVTLKQIQHVETVRKQHNNYNSKKKILVREKELLEKNKIRISSRQAGNITKNIKPATRFSIVNQTLRERKRNNDLYIKFSKMSVNYTQAG